MQRSTLAIFMFSSILCFCVGCEQVQERYGITQDRYEIKEDKQGRTLRLDKKTGEIVFIQGDKVVLPQKAPDATQLAQPKFWPTVDLPPIGDFRAYLSTSWREDKLYYQFRLFAKDDKPFDDSSPRRYRFTLEFLDSGGFKIEEANVKGDSLIRTVDDKGKPFNMEVNESIPCSAETYLSISSWNVVWHSLY